MTRQFKDQARQAVLDDEENLLALSHRIHANPELAWHEFNASTWLADELEHIGFSVTRGVGDLPTAFLATIGSGDLHLGICAEYDALPGMGHACGHNIIAAAALGVGVGLARLVDALHITVSVLGTPAEEGGGGKIHLLERGVFDGIDAAMMIHPGPMDVALAEPFAVSHLHVHYDGKAAHAAAYPDEGVNAADAFTVAQVAIGLLRQQLPGSVRVHGVVTEGGDAPNIIPESTDGRWYVRASTLSELDVIEPKVRNCFAAGALATGCSIQIKSESPRYSEFRNDHEILGCFVENARELGRPFDEVGSAGRMNRASTDMGNVSLAIPSIHPYLGIDSLPASNHQRAFAECCATPPADKAVLDGAIAMAWTAIDLATNRWLRNRLNS